MVFCRKYQYVGEFWDMLLKDNFDFQVHKVVTEVVLVEEELKLDENHY